MDSLRIPNSVFAVLSASCIFINGIMLVKIITHPNLWSTINIFLSLILLSNFFIGSFEFALPSMEFLMEKRDFCLATFMPLQFHRFFTLVLSIWLVFLRSMIIQRAREIKYKVTKSGRISEDNNLGLLVSLICTTIIVGYVLIIFFHPLFPEGFGDIRIHTKN